MKWLARLLGRSRRLDQVRVVMYTRDGCHLCHDAWRLLESEQKTHGFHLDSIDIAGDEDLTRLHGQHIPVVAVDGKIRFRGIINRPMLRRLFDALASQRPDNQ